MDTEELAYAKKIVDEENFPETAKQYFTSYYQLLID
jgi:hypothetical protein